MAHYIFNVAGSDYASTLLQAGTWGIDPAERHADGLAAGDSVLIYVGAPERTFVGRAELASPVHAGGVLLTGIERWDPTVPMEAVLARLDRSAGARADFDEAVVRITAGEYETAVAVARATG